MIAADRLSWHMMYLGAFAALKVENVEIATALVEHTRSDEEAIGAVAVMRDARPGDRVYPALHWLMAKRRA